MNPEDFETQARALCADAGRDPDAITELRPAWMQPAGTSAGYGPLWVDVARELHKADALARALQA